MINKTEQCTVNIEGLQCEVIFDVNQLCHMCTNKGEEKRAVIAFAAYNTQIGSCREHVKETIVELKNMKDEARRSVLPRLPLNNKRRRI